jgi:hypothetical protein
LPEYRKPELVLGAYCPSFHCLQRHANVVKAGSNRGQASAYDNGQHGRPFAPIGLAFTNKSSEPQAVLKYENMASGQALCQRL